MMTFPRVYGSFRSGFLLVAVVCSACFGAQPVRAEEPTAVTVDLTSTKTASAGDPKITALIAQLGAPDTVQREEAERALTVLGKAVIPLLKEAEASPNPEIAFRAKRLGGKLAELSVQLGSYAEILPSNAILYLEVRDAASTFDRFKTTPLGKFWEQPSTKKFISGHRLAMLPAEVKVFDALMALPKLATGRALFALSGPDTVEAHEIDPPLLYVLETQNMPALEANIRNMFDGMNDGVKTKRQYKKFQIEEQANACTVFGAQRFIHGLTAKGTENFLDNLTKPPQKPLSVLTSDMKTERPNADVYFRLASDGLSALGEANQILDEDLVKMIETVGLAEGGFVEDALTFNAEGVDESARISAGGNSKNKGLLAVLQRMAIKPAAPLQANQPQALDMIPYQAAFVASFNGDTAASSKDLAAALKALDTLGGQPLHVDVNPDAVAATGNTPKGSDAVAPPRPPPSNSPAAQALAAGGGNVLDDKKDVKTPADTNGIKTGRKAEIERTSPHLERLLHTGFSLEQLLEQASGPMVLALFPEQVDISRLANPGGANVAPGPDRVPMAAIFAMYLKDPAGIELALEKANKGLNPKYFKRVLAGGTLYAEDDAENSGGFWLRGNYLAFGTSHDILELVGDAVFNEGGNKRMAVRQSYVDYANKDYDPSALLNIYADAKQFLEMPYKMSQLQWQNDDKNPWPNFQILAGILNNNSIHIKIKQARGGLQIESQTPTSMIGLLQGILKPLKEAALVQ